MHKSFLHSRSLFDITLSCVHVGDEDAALLVSKCVGCRISALAKGEKPHGGRWNSDGLPLALNRALPQQHQLFTVLERVPSFICVQNLNAVLHWLVQNSTWAPLGWTLCNQWGTKGKITFSWFKFQTRHGVSFLVLSAVGFACFKLFLEHSIFLLLFSCAYTLMFN